MAFGGGYQCIASRLRHIGVQERVLFLGELDAWRLDTHSMGFESKFDT